MLNGRALQFGWPALRSTMTKSTRVLRQRGIPAATCQQVTLRRFVSEVEDGDRRATQRTRGQRQGLLATDTVDRPKALRGLDRRKHEGPSGCLLTTQRLATASEPSDFRLAWLNRQTIAPKVVGRKRYLEVDAFQTGSTNGQRGRRVGSSRRQHCRPRLAQYPAGCPAVPAMSGAPASPQRPRFHQHPQGRILLVPKRRTTSVNAFSRGAVLSRMDAMAGSSSSVSWIRMPLSKAMCWNPWKVQELGNDEAWLSVLAAGSNK